MKGKAAGDGHRGGGYHMTSDPGGSVTLGGRSLMGGGHTGQGSSTTITGKVISGTTGGREEGAVT